MYGKHKQYIVVVVIKYTRSNSMRCMICVENNDASWMVRMKVSKFSRFALYSTLWYGNKWQNIDLHVRCMEAGQLALYK